MPPKGAKPDMKILSALAKAFEFMKYDVGLLSQGEARVMGGNVKIDTIRHTAEETPFSVVLSPNEDKIGFLRFPSLPNGQDVPSEKLIKRITKIVKEEQANVRLLVGLSDWGWVGEREYLAQNPENVPDLLLGSGRGSGVNGRLGANDRCLWVRTYDKGRTLSEIQIFAWPERTSSFTWDKPNSINTLSIGLGDQYQDNPDVGALLH